jgi:hypothetical protein
VRLYQKSLIPISGMIYGQTIYWLTLLSSCLVLLGTIISFLEKDSPIPANQLLQSVIDGKSVDQIWHGIGLSDAPDMFFFLANPSFGESITMIGIGIGVSSVIPATFFSAYFLKKSRNPVFAVLAVMAGLLTCFAVSGITL